MIEGDDVDNIFYNSNMLPYSIVQHLGVAVGLFVIADNDDADDNNVWILSLLYILMGFFGVIQYNYNTGSLTKTIHIEGC